jgi:hypothetical protein
MELSVKRYRESLSRVAVSIALIATLVAVMIASSGGFGMRVGGVGVSAHHPLRAAIVAAGSFLLAIAVVGRRRALAIGKDHLIRSSAALRPIEVCAETVARVSNRYWIVLAGAALASFAALALTVARDRPFWHDEVFTILISQLPFATMYRAAADGIDLAPPLNTAITRVVHGVAGIGPVATRLTPIASFLMASALLFVMVRRRAGTLAALTAALLPGAMNSWPYVYEARGYALSMACSAAALHGWLEAAAGRRVRINLAILALALAAGLWTHYYFVLAVIPIAVGEAVRQVAARRFDMRPWAAIVVAGLIALPLWPLVRSSSAQRLTFWAKPDVDSPLVPRVQALFGSWLATPEQPLLAITAAVVMGLIAIELSRRAILREWPRRLGRHELAALGACLLLPVAGLLLGDFVGVFTERYVLVTIVGVILALVLGLWSVAPPSGLAEIAAVVGLFAATVHLGSRIISDRQPHLNPLEKHPVLADWLLRSPDPIVVTGGVYYLEIWYYTPASARPRALYLGDPDGEFRESHADTVSRGYSALARWTSLPVVPIDDFVASHPRFWMYSSGPDWIERSLTRRGATFIERARDSHKAGTLYEVRMKR